MVEEVILTLLKVTASGGIKVMNEGVVRMYMKTETWEVSAHSFFILFCQGVSVAHAASGAAAEADA
jgi:hypothetical protein